MMAMQQIAKLNRGEQVLTYQLVPIAPRKPVVGELRYIVPLVPNPAEPLAQMFPLRPQRIAWTGKEWVLA
ncbi:hypothetical protein [Bradyrhizobium erythrophlei]|uniref:Uncharacterized protein n=1 Tax=Bradyrhizobium erythrophlei TaxID=1437360 RepID=A0A1M5NE33_9BRAD|nr:hypothetical protein [Bradyrhizobium erythrophlei]SHG87725.1 hypothetical protein SAMN05443248_2955 [Bradyrhizobium erythrophlei]